MHIDRIATPLSQDAHLCSRCISYPQEQRAREKRRKAKRSAVVTLQSPASPAALPE
jgi:hypothetical protein